MAKWWTGALLAAGLMGTAAQAQYIPPAGGQAGAGSEPIPFPAVTPVAQGGGPGCAPSPMPGGGSCAPDLSLPRNIPNAWDDACTSNPACYGYVGGMGLMRQRLGRGPVALLDPGRVDTGDPVAATAAVAQDFNDLRPGFNWGVRGTFGYHWDTNAIELTGYYLFGRESGQDTLRAGRLDTFFSPTLVGFNGNNGLFLQADIVRTTLDTAVGSGELNYHWWLGSSSTFHWLLGVRYLDVNERLGIFVDDEGLSNVNIAGQPNPLFQAKYTVRAHNRLVAPQLGGEYSHGLTPWLAVTGMFKGAWGVNFVDIDHLLRRGDGLVGLKGRQRDEIFSHAYEAGLFADLCFSANSRIRAGYNLLWIVDVAEAVDQVSFDLRRPNGIRRDDGSIFYHGPVFEFQIVF